MPSAGGNRHRKPPAYPLGVCRNVERFADCTTCVKSLDERRTRVGVEYNPIPCVFMVVNWKERIQNTTVGVWSVEIKEVRAVAARVRSKAHQPELTCKERHSRMGVNYLNPYRVLVVAQRRNA